MPATANCCPETFFIPGNHLRIVYEGKVRDITVDIVKTGGRYASAPYVLAHDNDVKGYRNFTLSKITDVSRVL